MNDNKLECDECTEFFSTNELILLLQKVIVVFFFFEYFITSLKVDEFP